MGLFHVCTSALRLIREEKMSPPQAAKKKGIPYTTLWHKLQDRKTGGWCCKFDNPWGYFSHGNLHLRLQLQFVDSLVA